jgi:quercetin dioxygenase-like cupin family protein
VSRRGQVFSNPVTGERSVALTDPADHPERVLVSHLFVAPGGRVAAEHYHPTVNERFHVLAGQVAFLIDGREVVLGPGDRAEVVAGVRHDWWQVGGEEAQVVVEVSPGDRFVEVVGTLFGLAREGKTDPRGLPHPLQAAVSIREYRDVIVFTKPPRWVQRLLFGALAWIGRARGLRPHYPEHLHSDDVVEPDPTALEVLTPDGRLRFDEGTSVSGSGAATRTA